MSGYDHTYLRIDKDVSTCYFNTNTFKGLFTWREGNPPRRVTLLGGSIDSPRLHV